MVVFKNFLLETPYKMSILRINRQLFPQLVRPFSSAISNDTEYTATPQYPPILDLSFEKKLERKKEADHEAIKAVKTVEEKQIKLNMPRYYGFKCYLLKEDHIPYNNLNLAQHVTRTHLIEKQQLPEYFNKIETDSVLSSLKADVEEAVLFELEGYRRMHDIKEQELTKAELENVISASISQQVNRVISNTMSKFYPHLVNVQIDIDPRIESFWYAGGMNPPENVKRYRLGQEHQKDRVNEPTNRGMYYLGSANVALRCNKPLLPVIPYSEAENPDLNVPFFQYDPRTVGITAEHKHISNIPGFWPGDPNQFGILSYHRRGHMLTRHYKDPQDDKEALYRQGILASFGWLSAQANFLGFNTYNDITYPLVTQTIITNGKLWSFYIYQLNTIVTHSKYVKENPKRNVCWATPDLKLYEEVDGGKLVGFNEDVLKTLVKMYANVPESRLGVNMTPYLSQEEKVCADYKDEEKRTWLEREYKYLVANRPRFKLDYEIYAWEKIYKIDNETRFMDKKTRPFELKQKHWDRKLNERKPNYVPRALRPDLPKYKGRDAKEFFP